MKIYGRYLIIISRLDGSISLACIIWYCDETTITLIGFL